MTAEPTGPTRAEELHAHYAANAIATGHAADCAMVTADENWPTIKGRPSCTCRVGGNTPAEQIAWRNAHPGWVSPAAAEALRAERPRPGEDLVRELHAMSVMDRIRLLDWLARNRTGHFRSALREWKSTRPLQSRPVVPPMTVPGPPDTRYPPPGE